MLRDIARNTLPLGLRIAIRNVFPVDPDRLALAEIARRMAAADHANAQAAGSEQHAA